MKYKINKKRTQNKRKNGKKRRTVNKRNRTLKMKGSGTGASTMIDEYKFTPKEIQEIYDNIIDIIKKKNPKKSEDLSQQQQLAVITDVRIQYKNSKYSEVAEAIFRHIILDKYTKKELQTPFQQAQNDFESILNRK